MHNQPRYAYQVLQRYMRRDICWGCQGTYTRSARLPVGTGQLTGYQELNSRPTLWVSVSSGWRCQSCHIAMLKIRDPRTVSGARCLKGACLGNNLVGLGFPLHVLAYQKSVCRACVRTLSRRVCSSAPHDANGCGHTLHELTDQVCRRNVTCGSVCVGPLPCC